MQLELGTERRYVFPLVISEDVLEGQTGDPVVSSPGVTPESVQFQSLLTAHTNTSSHEALEKWPFAPTVTSPAHYREVQSWRAKRLRVRPS